jgi:hypothetical protein
MLVLSFSATILLIENVLTVYWNLERAIMGWVVFIAYLERCSSRCRRWFAFM